MTPELWSRARSYLFTYGRTLDQARFAYLLEDGEAQAVLDALLEGFQNADGGFGRALEPDIRAHASSVIATVHGLEILAELDPGLGHPAAKRAIAYLLEQYQSSEQVWPMVSPAVEDAPHAPWWTYAGTAAAFDGFAINPTAAIAAALLHFDEVGSDADWLPELIQTVVARIEAKRTRLDLNETLTVLALRDAPGLDTRLRSALETALAETIPAVVASDPAAWTNYTLQPLDVAPTPDAWAAHLLDDQVLARNLDYWAETQLPDGSWPLPWRWDFVDAAAWQQAEQDWKGVHIVKRLQTLRAYGRI